MISAWTAAHVCNMDLDNAYILPPIRPHNFHGLDENRVYWDMWPVQNDKGHIVKLAGREMWMALSSRQYHDPAARHFDAKIQWLENRNGQWIDCGPVLPDFAVPYEREWAGSALLTADKLTLFFTGAGAADRPRGYQQRLYAASAQVTDKGELAHWTEPRLIIQPIAGSHYDLVNVHSGLPGKIKAFRDPAYFRDPSDGQEYIIFTGSLAASQSAYNGAIGIARKSTQGDWQILPPLVHADQVNNELERAHMVYHQGRYYVFWVTQRSTFDPDLRHAPNGLYGMVSDTLFGEYVPLNGSGLVLANPEDEPLQSYSWFVTADLIVSSFVDIWGLKGSAAPTDPQLTAQHFGGVPAPLLALEIDGEYCSVAKELVS